MYIVAFVFLMRRKVHPTILVSWQTMMMCLCMRKRSVEREGDFQHGNASERSSKMSVEVVR